MAMRGLQRPVPHDPPQHARSGRGERRAVGDRVGGKEGEKGDKGGGEEILGCDTT